MNKFNRLIALALFAGTIALTPYSANAQSAQDDKAAQEKAAQEKAAQEKAAQEKAAQEKAAQEIEFINKWYESCEKKKDDQCLPLSKEMLEKYPDNTYAKFAKRKIENAQLKAVNDKFRVALAALEAYYKIRDATRLEQLFTAGEEYLKVQPAQQYGQQYMIGQLAIAGAYGVLDQFYKNMDKVKRYADQSLKIFDTATPPEGWKPEEWVPLRELVLASMNQFMGYYLVETKGDQDDALAYLTKATEVKSKDGAGWKDPNNYLFRSGIYGKKLADLRKQYDQLPEDQKNGDAGKALLKQISQLLDTRLIPEYARVLATTTRAEHKTVYDQTKPAFDSYWNFRTDAPDKAVAYIKAFEADPTVAGPEVPAKAEDTAMTAPDVPISTSAVKTLTKTTQSSSKAKGTTTNGKSGTNATVNRGKTSSKRRK